MIDQKLAASGRSGNIIREISEYGAKQAKLLGEEKVYNFTIGSPSIDPPRCVYETMERLLATVPAAKLHSYTPAAGLPEVREKAAAFLNRSFGTAYRAQDIILTPGTSTCLAVLTRVLLSGGGRAMTFAPYFMEYKYYAESVGSSLTECPSDPLSFQLDLDAAERALTSDTVMQREYGHAIYIVADEPYRDLVYDGQEPAFIPTLYKNTIFCYSFSKSLSLPGERVGFMALPPALDDYDDIASAILAVLRAFGYICVSNLWQRVAVECLGQTGDLSVYKSNRDLLYGALTQMGYTCVYPDGAFYLFGKTPEPDAEAFCRRAMRDNLLLVPGDSFGTKGYVRLAYCVSRDMIERSLPVFRALAEEYGLGR